MIVLTDVQEECHHVSLVAILECSTLVLPASVVAISSRFS
jgi:hypothetical protein